MEYQEKLEKEFKKLFLKEGVLTRKEQFKLDRLAEKLDKIAMKKMKGGF